MRALSLILCVAAASVQLGCRTDPNKSRGSEDGLIDDTTDDGDGDGVGAAEDCDDANASVSPDAEELCDGIDNDCDGEVDEGVTGEFYTDADGDGFGDPTTAVQRCAAEPGEVNNAADCDDTDAAVFPDAPETCNGEDDDCDGVIDNDALRVFYTDADGDGAGDPEAPVESCELEPGLSETGDDCDDTNPDISPDATEVCNEVDDNCDGTVDEGVTNTFYADTDGDGYGAVTAPTEACAEPAGYSAVPGDCDDTNPTVSPDGEEVCNGADDNCDGTVDEATASDAGTWYTDADRDGYGDSALSTASCAAPSGTVADSSDCDDGDSAVNPGATEVCNGTDDNCDGTVDEATASDAGTWYTDADGDGYGDSALSTVACTAPSGTVANGTDCDDGDSAVNPGATEVCNGTDDNCDGSVDEATASDAGTWYTDADGDGYGDSALSTVACTAPSGTVSDDSDCDDGDSAVNPAATEVCNGTDDDCDGRTDDDDPGLDSSTATTWYTDADLDGYGVSSSTVLACADPGGVAPDSGDCDDGNADAYPGAPEPCSSGADLDCDGTVPDTCTSCLEVLDDGASVGDGLYTIDPDGVGGRASLETWCDMTTDGGGWTLVQRTVWDWDESSQLDTTQSQWHGTTYGDPSPGYAFRMAGALWPSLQVEQEHLLVHVPRDASSGGDCSELYYTGTGGAYSVSSSSTTITSITSTVTFINNTTLSTSDAGPSTHCPNLNDAVPWFYSSCCTTCPTFFGSYWSDEAHPMASYLDSADDLYGNRDSDVCASGSAVTTIGYEGVNDMAYFLR